MVYNEFTAKLVHAYSQIKIGNPLDESIHMGPLIDQESVDAYLHTLRQIKQEGGRFLVEGGLLHLNGLETGFYVAPAIAEVRTDMEVVRKETFAPVLYVMKYDTIGEAIRYQNDVSQGLSSAIITNDVR